MIILDAPNGKHPGPDGVPAICFKAFARQLTPVFQEAWEQLLAGESSPHIGMRKWTVAPKVEGASTTSKLRDIELCNEARKVLARMLNKVLDERLKEVLGDTQQAFVSGRDIIVNNVRMHSVFNDWLQHHGDEEEATLLMLLLDCSKGYNFLSWSWVERCLETAQLPIALRQLVTAMLRCEARLVINGQEYGGLNFTSTQACHRVAH